MKLETFRRRFRPRTVRAGGQSWRVIETKGRAAPCARFCRVRSAPQSLSGTDRSAARARAHRLGDLSAGRQHLQLADAWPPRRQARHRARGVTAPRRLYLGNGSRAHPRARTLFIGIR